ncbi:hypothetical protein, partial [Sorangium cellulosum]|uniref:hypothetical protein n=1 Tax=Sorangium cellulosum TaxID=56 RepID=UPI001F3005BC
ASSPSAEAGAPAARSAARDSTIAIERMSAQYHFRAAAGKRGHAPRARLSRLAPARRALASSTRA